MQLNYLGLRWVRTTSKELGNVKWCYYGGGLVMTSIYTLEASTLDNQFDTNYIIFRIAEIFKNYF